MSNPGNPANIPADSAAITADAQALASLSAKITADAAQLAADVAAIPPSSAAPGPVVGLTPTPGDTIVGLSWSAPVVDPTHGAATGYEISPPTPPATTAGLSYTATGLTNGEQYQFSVTATNATGPGPVTTIPATPVAPPPSGNPNPFTQTWAKPLATPTKATNQTWVANFVAQTATYNGVGVNNTTYGDSITSVPAGQTAVPLTVTKGANDFTPNTGKTAPYPSGLIIATGGDKEVSVYQPSTDTLWETWITVPSGGGYAASWGGKIVGCTTTKTGTFTAPYGVAASGLPKYGIDVTFADIQAGAIDHVLGVVVQKGNGFIAPANRSDANTSGGIPYGTWFQMPATATLPSGQPTFAHLVFKALQQYGMVVIDQGGAVMLSAQLAAQWTGTGSDPITASFGGKQEYNVLSAIPWASMIVINNPLA